MGGVKEQEQVAAELHRPPHAAERTARRMVAWAPSRSAYGHLISDAVGGQQTDQASPSPPLLSLSLSLSCCELVARQCRRDGVRRLHLAMCCRRVQTCRWRHLGLRRRAAARPWLYSLFALESYLDLLGIFSLLHIISRPRGSPRLGAFLNEQGRDGTARAEALLGVIFIPPHNCIQLERLVEQGSLSLLLNEEENNSLLFN